MAAPDRGISMDSSMIMKDLFEKKRNLHRIASEVSSMASELRDVRTRMAEKEACLEQETARRQLVEAKAKDLERELEHLQTIFGSRSSQTSTSVSVAEQYLRELVDVRAKLGVAQAAAKANEKSVNAANLHSTSLLKEIERNNIALEEKKSHVMQLQHQMTELQKDLKQREYSQQQLQEEVERLQSEIKMTAAKVPESKESEFKKVLEEASKINEEHLVKLLGVKDEEVAQFKEDIKTLLAQVKTKSQELEMKLDEQKKANCDLKKKVVKLEFMLQEDHLQAHKLQQKYTFLSGTFLLEGNTVGYFHTLPFPVQSAISLNSSPVLCRRLVERKDKELKELHGQISLKEANSTSTKETPDLWNLPSFKILLSISGVVLFYLAKR